ncbi:MAG: methionyl-tRNA formyltransferase [Gammaproteobacteria bacterium]|nr:methionyl-tRNA formyltransferase [Gammaproteobacteria bacterium]
MSPQTPDTLPPLKVIFAGTPEFAATALQALIDSPHQLVAVYTQPDRPAGRGRKLTASPVKQLAEVHHLPVYQPHSLKDSDAQEQLAELKADVMIVAAYGLILPQAVLTIPPMGCLNIHASLLPRWRGAAPIQRAILAGDSKTGITIMQMDVGLDTGDMLLTKTTSIQANDTAQTLHDCLATLGAEALLDALGELQTDSVCPIPQDDALSTYAKKLEKSEALMNWQQPASELARQVQAFNPWPVAQTTMGDKVLRIWEAEATTDGPPSATPGQVIHAAKGEISVATGEGSLRLLKLQLPGGRPVGAGDFLNAHNLEEIVLGG